MSVVIDQSISRQPATKQDEPRTVGLATATGIVVANIIGFGIFTSLGFQVAAIQSGFALLLVWVIGGVLSLCGAVCYGELSAALPRSGGEYHFLSVIYHPAVGFMAGFVSATVGFAAPVALAAMAFGKYLDGIFGTELALVASFVVVWIVTAFHLLGVRPGAAFQNLSTCAKIVVIALLIGAGLLIPHKQPVQFVPAAGDASVLVGSAFAVALTYVMYSYSGWNAAAYIAGEIKRPEVNVPRALLLGTGVVMVLYTALNAVFLLATPMAELRGQVEVGLIAGKHIFGEEGGRVVGGIICLGLLSAISSMTWIGPRVTMSMGEDHWLLRFLGRRNSRGIPANAILGQTVIVTLLLLTRSFELVVIYIQFSLLLCSLLTVAGVIVLRRTRPDLPRPSCVWAYPLPVVVFCVATLWMMIYLLYSHPAESILGLGTMVLGLIVYRAADRRPLVA
ncbi:MAG: APC family permease [Chthoniobacterales bacterium]